MARQAERACSSEVASLERSLGCRLVGKVTWSPLHGTMGEVKIFRARPDGKIDTSEMSRELTDAAARQIDEVTNRHQVVILPVLTVTGEAMTVQLAFIAVEAIEAHRQRRGLAPLPDDVHETSKEPHENHA